MIKYLFVLAFLVSSGHSTLWGADTLQRILFISDTQQPLWIETLRLQAEHNEEATQRLFTAIRQDTTASAVFHLGDFSAMGMFDAYWHPFDAFQRSLRIPIHPVLGNHDYYIFPFFSMKQFHHRFPDVDTTWYATTVGAVVIVVLNSNFSHLSDDEQKSQRMWYSEKLSLCSRDSTVKAIIVVCHHPPYTNSDIIDPSLELQNEFVHPFVANDKCTVFITGHAHTYEHFKFQGKIFLVIGGGGGLIHPMKSGARQIYHDEYSDPASPRFFHYLECSITPASLDFTVHKLRDDYSGFDLVDPFTVRLDR